MMTKIAALIIVFVCPHNCFVPDIAAHIPRLLPYTVATRINANPSLQFTMLISVTIFTEHYIWCIFRIQLPSVFVSTKLCLQTLV